jgi:hypothetical protein
VLEFEFLALAQYHPALVQLCQSIGVNANVVYKHLGKKGSGVVGQVWPTSVHGHVENDVDGPVSEGQTSLLDWEVGFDEVTLLS